MVWTRWVNISKVPPMISPIQQINVVKQCVTLVVTYDLWGFHIRGQRVQLVLFKCQVNKKILPWIDHATKLDPELLCELQNLLFCWTLYRNMFNNKTFFLWSPPSYWWSGLSSESSEWQENAHCLQGHMFAPVKRCIATALWEALSICLTIKLFFKVSTITFIKMIVKMTRECTLHRPGKPPRTYVCTYPACEALHRSCTNTSLSVSSTMYHQQWVLRSTLGSLTSNVRWSYLPSINTNITGVAMTILSLPLWLRVRAVKQRCKKRQAWQDKSMLVFFFQPCAKSCSVHIATDTSSTKCILCIHLLFTRSCAALRAADLHWIVGPGPGRGAGQE